VEGVLGNALVSVAVEVSDEVGHGGGRGFDGDNAVESPGERLGEESDAGVEIPGERALPPCNDLFEQFRNEVAIHLKECASADLITMRADDVLQRWLAPGGGRLDAACLGIE
jgi:hypothetical protein